MMEKTDASWTAGPRERDRREMEAKRNEHARRRERMRLDSKTEEMMMILDEYVRLKYRRSLVSA
jgi:hypothetical protein